MIDISDARRSVLRAARRSRPVQSVSVVEAPGHVLAAPVVSDTDLPPFDRVMMDGFAVRAADLAGAEGPAGVTLPVAAAVAAGDEARQPLLAGQAHRIMTGAPLPPGADAVVPVEWTQVEGEQVCVRGVVSEGLHIAPRGEDIARGQTVAAAGTPVTAMSLSLLISAGAGQVDVMRRPRVAVLTSGNELVPPGQPLKRGQIRESNGPALVALLAATGAQVTNLGVARDTKEELADKLREALAADVVVLTGGSSVGDYDFTDEVVTSFGAQKHFEKLRVKPGKPTLFFTCGESLVFGLPGNPVAAMMTGRVLVCPAIAALSGRAVADWPDATAPLAQPVRRHAQRDLVIPVRRTDRGLVFEGWHGSGDLSSLARADAFAFIGSGDGQVDEGAEVTVFALGGATAW